MAHELQLGFWKRLRNLSPFGLGHVKPKHYRDMLRVVLRNRDNLGYAWKVLSRGACDGCALGTAGLRDWTLTGTHLCMVRLNLLRLNTMPEFDHQLLANVSHLEDLSDADLRDLGRISVPMIRERGEPGFRRIQWEEAYGRIAERIKHSDPKRLAFYLTSRGMTNEVYYVAQKVARWFGTNNIDNAARICHSPSTAAMKRSLGVAATTCSYRDWIGSDLVVFFGSNPANDQPVTTKYLQQAKKTGTRVVLVNPYREPAMERYWIPSNLVSSVFGTQLIDDWFPVNTGGDIAFLYGVLKIVFENGWHDTEFIDVHTEGVDALRRETERVKWEELESESGLSQASMKEFANLIHRADSAVFVWSMGITQHVAGADAVQMIINLGLVKGYVGRDKCGLMPIRGHSGVQGGAEMGAYATAFPGGRPVSSESAALMREVYGFNLPDQPGLTAPEMIDAAAENRLDLLYCAGGNFVQTLPDPDYVTDAMSRVPLRVHQDIFLTKQLFIEPIEKDGAVILLPARTRYEQEGGGTQTSTERRVIFSPEIDRSVGEAKSEWRIFLELAHAVDAEHAGLLGCTDSQAIREEIAHVVPAYDGIQHFAGTGDAIQYGGPHLCDKWEFPTPDGQAHFVVVQLPFSNKREGWFKVSTRRGRQFNSLIYGEVDPINNAGRDSILMNPEDAGDLKFSQHQKVKLISKTGVFEGRILFASIARGNLQVHFPEGNVLIPRGIVDAGGGVPDYNTEVRVEADFGRLR
ncbi:MAG: FdhF/YdeP family oxidoreductase [Acidobacteriota bacterium]|jgi:molybdopterin-dependent oxidoreductase alpha subunit|nr:FdhF/YdeP family oxidoreductase [Acidobacteriota bacterium]